MTGFAELPVEAISLNPMEQKRLIGVRTEIVNRDKFCTFPVLYGKRLVDLEVTASAMYGDVHHITPISFLQLHRPETDPNHPINLITLDGHRHNMLHREWVERYARNARVIKEQVYYGGQAGWVDDYDEALTGIAIIRTHDYLLNALNPSPYFTRYADEVSALYGGMDQGFINDYRKLVARYSGLFD